MILRTSKGFLVSTGIMPLSSSAGKSGSLKSFVSRRFYRHMSSIKRRGREQACLTRSSEVSFQFRFATTDRAIANACSSLLAKWSDTPEIRQWTSAPPSSSAVTTSPVAAFTSGGPPRKIVPVPW